MHGVGEFWYGGQTYYKGVFEHNRPVKELK